MSSDGVAIRVSNLSKCFQIYETPKDRLKQLIVPRLQKIIGHSPRQYFREFWALRGVSFEVRKGETVGIVGCNGSGKSTLLQMICGTLSPTNGSVETHGRIAALLELGSGFNPEFTGRENVYMNAAVLGLNKEEVDARFDNIVAFADIGDFIEQPIKSFSSGMVVRLAFAVAINVDPEILVVDEALSVGDELFQRKCYSRIESIKNSGATILFVSHSATTIVELCDRAILLDAGELLVVDDPKLIVGNYQKLLYAPSGKRDEILNKIQGITQEKHQVGLNEIDEVISRDYPEQVEIADPEEFFDIHLTSKSMFEFESHGAFIREPKITDLQGRYINKLTRDRRYKCSYKVEFDRSASNVRFGMLIKTTSGFPLGGALSSPSINEAISFIDGGSTVFVEFAFKCCLNPGLYFINAGVFGSIDQEETVLHRIVDAMVFRVLPLEHNLATEIVDFGFVPEISINA